MARLLIIRLGGQIIKAVSSDGDPISQGIVFPWDLGVISNSLGKRLIAVT